MPDTTSRPEPSETVLTDAFLMVATAVPGSRVLNEAHLPPATAEPSDLVKASPLLMEMLRLGMDPREVERRALGAKHLGEVYSSIPWHAQRAEQDPDYWNELYGSSVNWWHEPLSAESSTSSPPET
jgi:hypothetical protein